MNEKNSNLIAKSSTMSDIPLKNNGICYIVGAGDIKSDCSNEELFNSNSNYSNVLFLAKNNDMVIASDGGYKILSNAKIRIDYCIGDFDSLGYIPKEENIAVLPTEKDVTDMQACYEYGKSKGYENFHIYCGLGGSIRHSIANIQLLNKIADDNLKGYLISDKEVITVIKNSSINFTSNYSGMISIFASGDTAKAVSISGLKYNIDNMDMRNSYPIGVSNEYIGKNAKVSVKNGKLVIIYDRQNIQ